jgi:hypothetical protein
VDRSAPVQILDHQHQAPALGQAVQHPEQQLEQPAGHGRGRGAELGHLAGQLDPGPVQDPLDGRGEPGGLGVAADQQGTGHPLRHVLHDGSPARSWPSV